MQISERAPKKNDFSKTRKIIAFADLGKYSWMSRRKYLRGIQKEAKKSLKNIKDIFANRNRALAMSKRMRRGKTIPVVKSERLRLWNSLTPAAAAATAAAKHATSEASR